MKDGPDYSKEYEASELGKMEMELRETGGRIGEFHAKYFKVLSEYQLLKGSFELLQRKYQAEQAKS